MVIWIFAIAVFIHLMLEYTKTQNIRYAFAAMFILSISSMQLVEFFIHYKVKAANKWVFYVFILQFIFSEVYIWSNNSLPIGACVLDVVFYVCIFVLLYRIYGKPTTDSVSKCDYSYLTFGCKLDWGVITDIKEASLPLTMIIGAIYMVYILITAYYTFTLPIFITFLVILIMTVFMPGFIAFAKSRKLSDLIKTNGSSSAWCFIAVILLICTISLDESSVIQGV